MPVTSLSGARDKYKDKIKLINDIQDALEEIKGNKKWVEITDIDLAKKNLTRKDLLWFTANRNINMIVNTIIIKYLIICFNLFYFRHWFWWRFYFVIFHYDRYHSRAKT